jgi:hypothetical protein
LSLILFIADFENQGAHSLAKKYDPEGTRTIGTQLLHLFKSTQSLIRSFALGVLTKPDRIPAGEEPNWLPFIRNEKERLKHNWFCVKQPSSSDLKLNLTWAGARKMETAFFADTSPWCDLDSEYQQYLCTSNLVNRLSSVLSDLISQRSVRSKLSRYLSSELNISYRLPPIQIELERSIRATRTLLARLPCPPLADPRSEIITLLHAFTSDLSRHVEGVPDDKSSTFGKGIGLIQAIRPAQERFKMMIRATEPNFKPFKRSEKGEKRLGPATFLENEESDEEASDIEIDEEGVKMQKGDEEMGDNREECNDDDKERTGEDEQEEAEVDKKAPPKMESRPHATRTIALT